MYFIQSIYNVHPESALHDEREQNKDCHWYLKLNPEVLD
jgi:hypothetical protein